MDKDAQKSHLQPVNRSPGNNRAGPEQALQYVQLLQIIHKLSKAEKHFLQDNIGPRIRHKKHITKSEGEYLKSIFDQHIGA